MKIFTTMPVTKNVLLNLKMLVLFALNPNIKRDKFFKKTKTKIMGIMEVKKNTEKIFS